MVVMAKIFQYLLTIGKLICHKQFSFAQMPLKKCSISPTGYQWFDLMDQTSEQVLMKSIVAEIKLNKFIDEVKSKYDLPSEKIILSGFSQGCMITLQTGLKKR